MGRQNQESIRYPHLLLSELSRVNFSPSDLKSIPDSNVSYSPLASIGWGTLSEYCLKASPVHSLVEALRTVPFVDQDRVRCFQLESATTNQMTRSLTNLMYQEGNLFVARNIIISPAGPDGGVLLMTRRRANKDSLPGYLETPGGKVPKEYQGQPVGVSLQDSIDQAHQELLEEVGDLAPSSLASRGTAISLATNGRQTLVEVAEVKVVTPLSILHLCLLANSRRDQDNIEWQETGYAKESWLPGYYPRIIHSEQFLPTSILNLKAVFGETPHQILNSEWRGLGVFLPRRVNFNDNIDNFPGLNGRRANLWDLNLPNIHPAVDVHRRKS